MGRLTDWYKLCCLNKYYPTNVLVTGFDIIFFWVARMIMMGIKFMGDVPFREVYIHGLVRDGDGNKMSKSKGNILDPLDLIDGIELDPLIKKRTTGLMRPEDAPKIEAATVKHFPDGIPSYGTDALRFTFASMATQGRDIKFDLGRVGGYRNFCNKIWNAARFVMMMCEQGDVADDKVEHGLVDRWIQSEFNRRTAAIREGFETYRFDLASQALYEFIWDEYCDWYIEFAKIDINDADLPASRKAAARRCLVASLEQSLRALHPIMPYVTEEIWLRLTPLIGKDGATIMNEGFPEAGDNVEDKVADATVSWLKAFVLGVRRIRAEFDISPSQQIPIKIFGSTAVESDYFEQCSRYIQRLSKASEIEVLDEPYADQAATAIAGETSIYIPLSDLIDRDAEVERLKKELTKLEKDRIAIDKKLQNPAFVEKAPAEIVENQRTRLAELNENIAKLNEQLAKW
ncbi:MAG: class I tRNA ligase family protein [Pseudomonadota bacterium]